MNFEKFTEAALDHFISLCEENSGSYTHKNVNPKYILHVTKLAPDSGEYVLHKGFYFVLESQVNDRS